MRPSSPDKILLSGALQVDTAIDALSAVDVNPKAKDMLQNIRNVHKQTLIDSPDGPDNINLFFGPDDTTSAMKADIIVGLELLSMQSDTPEQKLAAQALLEVMNTQEFNN